MEGDKYIKEPEPKYTMDKRLAKEIDHPKYQLY